MFNNKNKLGRIDILVKKDFEYNSRNNNQWFSNNELLKMIKNIK
jgi:hypothetical protein